MGPAFVFPALVRCGGVQALAGGRVLVHVALEERPCQEQLAWC